MRAGLLRLGMAMAATALAAMTPAPTPGPLIDPAAPEVITGDPLTMDVGEDRYRRMTVPVTVNGKGPYPFVIDTGAERTFFSEELADELGMVGEDEVTIQTVSGLYRIPILAASTLDILGDQTKTVATPVLPRGRLGALGILGLDTLADSRILFNIADSTMSVSPSKKKKKRRRPKVEPGTIVVTAERRRGRLIFTHAEINGVDVRVVLDTGAEMSLGNMALREALLERRKKEELVEIVDVMGVSLDAQLGRVKRLTMDDLTIKGGAIAFGDAPVFARLGIDDDPAVLLGMETMRAFDSVAVDFPNRQVSFRLPEEGVVPTGLNLNCGGTRIAKYGC